MPTTTEQCQQSQTTAETPIVKEELTLEDNKVFVGNLAFKTTQETLAEFFKSSGKVVEATIIKHGRRSLGFGFVAFETAAEAEKARKELDKKELDGREINVEVAKSKVVRADDEKKTKSPEALEKARARKKQRRAARKAKLAAAKKEAQQQNGDKPAETNESNAASATDNANGAETSPKKTRRRRRAPATADNKQSESDESAQPSKPAELSKTALFVSNLPYSATDDVFRTLFEGYKVNTAHIARMRNGRPKGYGFVDFSSEEEQQRALENIKDVELEGRVISLKIALAGRLESLSERRAASPEAGKKSDAQPQVKEATKKEQTKKADEKKSQVPATTAEPVSAKTNGQTNK